MRYPVLGVCFDNITLSEAADRAMALMHTGRGYIVTPNPEIVMQCRADAEACAAVNGAALTLPDGIGIVYAARILGYPIAARVPGYEFAEALMERMAQDGKKLFLLGAKPGVAEKAAAALNARYPGLCICGTNDGYFKDDGPVLDKINQSGADAVFVCLGAPKQEKWMAANIDKTCARVMAGLGGSLDGFAGEVKRAPELWIKLNLEWLYRGLTMGRFFRLLRLPVFLLRVLAARMGGKQAC